MKKLKLTTLICSALLLSACNEGDTRLQDNIDTSQSEYPLFDPSNSVIPYPNNLLFKDSLDATLNIPFEPTDSNAAVVEALNTLDGFSTMAPLSTGFSVAVESSSLTPESSVRLFEVMLSGIAGAVTAINRELDSSEFAVSLDETETQLIITPQKTLAAKSSYLVVLTQGVTDKSGAALNSSLVYALTKSTEPLVDRDGVSQVAALTDEDAQALEPLRQLTHAAETATEAFASNLSRDQIILSWSFTTQSVDDVLQAVKTTVDNAAIPASVLLDSGADSVGGGASIYAGTLALPYYLNADINSTPPGPLSGYWQAANATHLTQFNPNPTVTGDQTLPLLVTIPNSAKPANGWPVVIFQHGITANRGSLLAIADTLATIGYAGVAIDLPLHGITGNETNGTQAFYSPGIERTFDMDLINNTTRQPGTDGITDESGSHFINLTSLLTSRDNVRQGVADLMSLKRALNNMDYDGGGADMDLSDIRFIGHSLGAMVGIPFLALESDIGAATLAMPGGGIAKLLDGSATFGPVIAAGLSANGVIKGTAEYESFMAATQMVLDSGDPLNYAAAAATGRGIHMIEVVGGNSSPADQVIPNDVLAVDGTVPSPTAGTDPLWRAMGLSLTNSTTLGTNLLSVVQFNAGHHSSLLSPFDALGNNDPLSAQVLAEMQGQTSNFIDSNGAELTISNPSVIKQ